MLITPVLLHQAQSLNGQICIYYPQTNMSVLILPIFLVKESVHPLTEVLMNWKKSINRMIMAFIHLTKHGIK